tara:strand:- start:1089 stop:1394 length:306 start_codon:yes stop_codon:yes gene_type:complete
MSGVQALMVLRKKNPQFRIPPLVQKVMDYFTTEQSHSQQKEGDASSSDSFLKYELMDSDRYTVPEHETFFNAIMRGDVFALVKSDVESELQRQEQPARAKL